MSDQKIKVKELAGELNVSTKELLAMLRELGIPAKSTMSTVSSEEIPRVKERIKSGPTTKEVLRKETASGVIVRRRKATKKSDKAAPAEQAEQVETKPVDNKVEEPPKTAKPEAKETPKPKADKARIVKPKVVETPAARVVTPAEEQATSEPEAKQADTPPKPVPAEAPAKPAEADSLADSKPAAEPKAKPVAAAQADEAASKEAAQPVAEEGDADDAKKKKKKKKTKKREEVATPQVRIISRPDPAAVAAQQAEERQARTERPSGADGRPGGGRPGGGRPGGPGGRPGGGRPGGPGGRPAGPAGGRPAGPGGARPAGGGRPGGPGFAPAEPTPADGDARKRRAKGKRTVDFSQDQFRDGGDDKGKKKGKKGKGQNQQTDSWGRPRKQKRGKKQEQSTSTQPLKAAKRKIKVDEAIRVTDMAHQMGIKGSEVIKILMQLGVMATINQSLDLETATIVCGEFGYEVEKVGFSEEDYLTPTEADTPESLKPRPPVVTIMGHVDHGKTSLLDAIRSSTVTTGEAGGITQHIGAYHVPTKRGDLVFLDTPGHEAFTAMRARGAEVTDIVILVVAADDGVMEQTREAISHAKAAEVPIVVAVNKMDKEDANPERVLRELSDHGLVPEDWGGDTIISYVSAKTGMGLEDLLELLALQAEVLELKANPDKPARGHIVEAKLDKGRGPVGTVLIQEGTLRQGDPFICGVFSGRVRAMFDDQGKKIKEAGPSMPVEVQGFEGVPEAGEEFASIADEKTARRIADARSIKVRERALAKESKVTLETFLSRSASDEEAQSLNVVLKADVQGSVEAIADALRKLATEKVKVDVIHSGAGAITESDILLASASDAVILGFNVRPTVKIREVADQEGVDIRFYDIIYKLVDEVKAAMTGLLAPIVREEYLGQAEVRETFSVPKIGVIAGCHVADGKIARHAGIRLLRDGVVIYTGKITSLKRFKDDAKEVTKGYECGVGLENFNDIKVNDVIEAFTEVEEAATL